MEDSIFIHRKEYLKQHHPEYEVVRVTLHDVTALNPVTEMGKGFFDADIVEMVNLYNSTIARELLMDIVPLESIDIFRGYVEDLNNYLSASSTFVYIDTPVLSDTDWLSLPNNFCCIERFVTVSGDYTTILTMEYSNEHTNNRFKN